MAYPNLSYLESDRFKQNLNSVAFTVTEFFASHKKHVLYDKKTNQIYGGNRYDTYNNDFRYISIFDRYTYNQLLFNSRSCYSSSNSSNSNNIHNSRENFRFLFDLKMSKKA